MRRGHSPLVVPPHFLVIIKDGHNYILIPGGATISTAIEIQSLNEIPVQQINLPVLGPAVVRVRDAVGIPVPAGVSINCPACKTRPAYRALRSWLPQRYILRTNNSVLHTRIQTDFVLV